MENTSSRSYSEEVRSPKMRICEEAPAVRKIEIFGKTIPVKDYICSRDGGPYPRKPEPNRLQLSICLTSFCSASCPFCIANNIREKRFIDLRKLETVLRGLKDLEIVRGISITGGEPFTDVTLLDETIRLLFEIFGYGMEVTVSTNGTSLWDMHRLRDLSRLDVIHVSRHHYDDALNRKIFGIRVPDAEELREIIASVSYRDLFVFNCMLQRSYIGTPEEVRRYLDFAIRMGVPKVAFIYGAKINAYAERELMDYEEVLRPEDENLLFTRGYRDYGICRCQDGVYINPEGRIISFYGRCARTDKVPYARGLVYDAENCLRTGFGGDEIIQM